MRDDREFTAFMTARWPTMVRSAVLLGCPRDDAEDMAQTALLQLYVSWAKVQAARDPDAYVYRVLVNCLKRRLGRNRLRETPVADPAILELPESRDVAEAVVERRTLTAALRVLSPDHRAVLVLRFVAGLSEQQLADALDVPLGTVKSRTSRAIRALTDQLQDHVEDNLSRGGVAP